VKNKPAMATSQPAVLVRNGPKASSCHNRTILLYAAPGCGAQSFMHALSQLKGLTLVPGAQFPVKDAEWIIAYFREPPIPGLHFLADYHSLLKAMRRLMDSIIGLTSPVADSTTGTRVIFSPDNILHIPTLRQLYPDALHLHLVRDISKAPLRMAADANLPVWRLCERWRQSERALLDAPPLPNQATIRYEELEHNQADAVGSFMSLAGLPFSADDQNAFVRQFHALAKNAHLRRPSLGTFNSEPHPSPLRGIPDRLAGRCAAVYCQAELAALKYERSIGHPGLLRTFAVVATLRLISRAGINRRRSGTGHVST
jgi:Sulfotransferase family